jgi:hypothetical protein
MALSKRLNRQTKQTKSKRSKLTPESETIDDPIEQEAAVEWGERIHTGKVIARSGRETGFVAGASPAPPDDRRPR